MHGTGSLYMTDNFENLNELLDHSLNSFGSRPLFGVRQGSGWSWTTYRQFGELVARCRSGLIALGIGAGDRVGIVADNRVEWAVACYAVSSIRAALVPMYAAQSAREWVFILEDSGARCVLAGSAEIAEQLRAAQVDLPELRSVIGLDESPDAASSWTRLLGASAAPPPTEQAEPDDTLAIIYTSGTTGRPKGVVLTQRNISSNVSSVRRIFPILPTDRSLSFLPWAHAFGQTSELHTLLSKGCAIAINDEMPRLIENLTQISPTILVAVPRIFKRIFDKVHSQMEGKPQPLRKLFSVALKAHAQRASGNALSMQQKVALIAADRLIFSQVRKKFGGKLRFAVSGSAALNPEVGRFIDALGIAVYEGYGLTEASPVVTANTPLALRPGTVGRVIPGTELEIDFSVGGLENAGELVVRGPNVMKGYFRRPDETSVALTDDGRLRTGDLGFIDEDGFVHITGRIKEQFKLENGKYVAPGPLEEELKMMPLVAHAMLHGANRPYNVALLVIEPAQVHAWAASEGIVLSSEIGTEPALRAYLGEHLQRVAEGFKSFERPRDFLVVCKEMTVESGELTPTLKLKRHAILARYGNALESLYGES